MLRRALAILLLASACAWAAPDGPRVELQPLSPYVHRFATEAGPGRIDYYYAEAPRRIDARFRSRLREAVQAAAGSQRDDSALRSIYVYRPLNGIGEHYRGTPETLRSEHLGELLSYTRWSQGELDMFYLIEAGEAVFDLLQDQPVAPPWEFR